MLNTEKKKIKEQFKKLLADCVLPTDGEALNLNTGDDADKSSQEVAYNLNVRLKGRNFIYLKKVQQALLRIDEGTFGECQECGGQISSQRLIARPTASKCLSCKEEEENSDNKFVHKNRYSFKRRSGQALSL